MEPALSLWIRLCIVTTSRIKNLGSCKISSPRTQIRAKALVTHRMQWFKIDGKVIHLVGMPWHWGYEGLSKGDGSTP
jgi:formate dehydrogenase major subunit